MLPAPESVPPSEPPRGGEVILIPKLLRMDWTDVIALDQELTPFAKAVANIIGLHFNKHRGDTYLRQDTIAALVGRASVPGVQKAIGQLEARGYLLVERRNLGLRADGSRVCGGRGVANTYRPALDGAQVSAIEGGKRLAARRDQLLAKVMEERTNPRWSIKRRKNQPGLVQTEPERTNGESEKNQPGYVPTLTDPSDQNPTRAGARASRAPLDEIAPGLRRAVGEAAFRSWLAGLRVVTVSLGKDGELVLEAPSRFIADRVQSEFEDKIARAFNSTKPATERVGRVIVRVHPRGTGGGDADR